MSGNASNDSRAGGDLPPQHPPGNEPLAQRLPPGQRLATVMVPYRPTAAFAESDSEIYDHEATSMALEVLRASLAHGYEYGELGYEAGHARLEWIGPRGSTVTVWYKQKEALLPCAFARLPRPDASLSVGRGTTHFLRSPGVIELMHGDGSDSDSDEDEEMVDFKGCGVCPATGIQLMAAYETDPYGGAAFHLHTHVRWSPFLLYDHEPPPDATPLMVQPIGADTVRLYDPLRGPVNLAWSTALVRAHEIYMQMAAGIILTTSQGCYLDYEEDEELYTRACEYIKRHANTPGRRWIHTSQATAYSSPMDDEAQVIFAERSDALTAAIASLRNYAR